MDSEVDDWLLSQPGYPIRTSPGLSLFAAHRSLAQPTTSFIASPHQGIHTCALSNLTINHGRLVARANLQRLPYKVFGFQRASSGLERPRGIANCSACSISMGLLRTPMPPVAGASSTSGSGGADRIRTDDPRLAKPLLCQLSYSPGSLPRGVPRDLRLSKSAALWARQPQSEAWWA